MKLIKLDPDEFGIEHKKAEQISKMFQPMLKKMVELEDEYNSLMKMELGPEAYKIARELRLKYVKIRTGTAEIHKKQKAFYLAGSRFIDGWKNAQQFASQQIEEKLIQIEKHEELQRQEEIDKLSAKRKAELQPFMAEHDTLPNNLGQLDGNIYNTLLTGFKAQHQRRIEDEKKAQEEKKRLKEIESLRWKRAEIIKPYYQFFDDSGKLNLGEISEEEFDKILSDLKERAKLHIEEQQRKEREKKELEKKLEKQKKDQEKQKAAADKKLAAERKAAAEKLEKLRKAKEDAERKIREKEEAEQAKLNAKDDEKYIHLITDLENLKYRYQFKSKKGQKIMTNVQTLIDKVTKYINENGRSK